VTGYNLRAVLWTGVTFTAFLASNAMHSQSALAAAQATPAAAPAKCVVSAHDQELLTDFGNFKRYKGTMRH